MLKKLFVAGLFGILTTGLSACNLYGGLDKPSGDAQLLSAARACLDQGDFTCAKNYYQALSNAMVDVKTSELTFTNLASSNIFSMKDLVTGLGDNSLGSPQSLLIMANLLASRGIVDGTTRTNIQTEWANSAAIQDPQLRAFMRFIVDVAMFSEVMANAAGPDGVVKATDLIRNPAACSVCAVDAGCLAPNGANTNNLLDDQGGSEVSAMSSATNWSGNPSTTKVLKAATDAYAQIVIFAPSQANSGVLYALQQISAVSTASAGCTRAGLYLLFQ